jgi:hypothetical protein
MNFRQKLTIILTTPLLATPSMAAIDYSKFFNPGEAVGTVASSPIGSALINILQLIVGLVVLGGVIALLMAFLKYIFGLKTGQGDSASDGYKGMGAIAIGGLVLVICIAMFFYFLEYKP